MKSVILNFLIALSYCTSVWAQTPGDINGDDQVGLPEAIYALRIASGMEIQFNGTTYDLVDYQSVIGSEYLYKESSGDTVGAFLLKVSAESINGKELKVEYNQSGQWLGLVKSYFDTTDTAIHHLGDYVTYPNGSSAPGEQYWFDPPVVIGSRAMRPGDVIYNIYTNNENHNFFYREYLLLGEEDVTVPAGTFPNCLKILQKRDGGYIRLSYYAKGVGLVKYISMGGVRYVWELASAKIGGVSYPAETSICTGQGSYSLPGLSEPTFTISFTPEKKPILTGVRLPYLDFGHYYSDMYYLISQDGIHFNENRDVYPEDITDYEIPLISLTFEDGTISGTLQPSPSFPETYTLTGSYTCSP